MKEAKVSEKTVKVVEEKILKALLKEGKTKEQLTSELKIGDNDFPFEEALFQLMNEGKIIGEQKKFYDSEMEQIGYFTVYRLTGPKDRLIKLHDGETVTFY